MGKRFSLIRAKESCRYEEVKHVRRQIFTGIKLSDLYDSPFNGLSATNNLLCGSSKENCSCLLTLERLLPICLHTKYQKCPNIFFIDILLLNKSISFTLFFKNYRNLNFFSLFENGINSRNLKRFL